MSAVVIGKFNALHLGHRALVERASQAGAVSLLGFSGMAQELGWRERPPVVAIRQRPDILASWSDAVGQPVRDVLWPFSEVRHLDPIAFIERLVRELAPDLVVVGTDFRFGRDRAGDIGSLKAGLSDRGVECVSLDLVGPVERPWSTTAVREALAEGAVEAVQRMLGRPHRLYGTVQKGDGRGRQLGFPTANLGSCENLLPAPGVYACRAGLPDGRLLPAAVNVGRLPTVKTAGGIGVEAHLIGFAGDCYGADLWLDMIERRRGEQRFESLDALRDAIALDVDAIARGFGELA